MWPKLLKFNEHVFNIDHPFLSELNCGIMREYLFPRTKFSEYPRYLIVHCSRRLRHGCVRYNLDLINCIAKLASTTTAKKD